MKASVDSTLCAGHGQCLDTCPQVFEMDGDVSKVKVDTIPPDAEQSCREAVDGCPVSAISIQD